MPSPSRRRGKGRAVPYSYSARRDQGESFALYADAADWPAKGDSYVAMEVTTYGSAGKILVEKSLFMAACVA